MSTPKKMITVDLSSRIDESGGYLVECGDCRDVMRLMEPESVDSIVSDPPYGIDFMGKGWDHGVPSVEFWKEAIRVAKPGAYLLAFGGTRTFHRLTVAIEDAGWEIRDTIMWVYGSGFPKSLNISKAIDKDGGSPPPADFAKWLRTERENKGMTVQELSERGKFYKNVNHGGLVSNWESGIGFPDAVQFNILCGLLDLPFERKETVEREILGWRKVMPGVAFSSDGPSELPVTAPATETAKQWDGWGTALKPAWEPIIVARKPFLGTVAANVLVHGTGGMNIDACRVEGEPTSGSGANMSNDVYGKYQDIKVGKPNVVSNQGRFPANLIHDGSDEVVAGFPITASGKLQSGHAQGGSKMFSNNGGENLIEKEYGGDSGSAARFFYCAKANQTDRNEGCEELVPKPAFEYGSIKKSEGRTGVNTPRANNHPTVKPTDLMRYLCRLVTQPNGIVLDPFMGSGSTGKAAVLEGFRFMGIDLNEEYCTIAKSRIKSANPKNESVLF